MTMLIVPMMPNKEEAWRRFMQELQGSQRQAFRLWCRRLSLEVKQVWLNETPGGTAVIVNLNVHNSKTALARLADVQTPFDHWLRQQILTLHGMDLHKLIQATSHSVAVLGGKDDLTCQ